jgi:hypothetical protein
MYEFELVWNCGNLCMSSCVTPFIPSNRTFTCPVTDNHHYEAYLVGAYSAVETFKVTPGDSKMDGHAIYFRNSIVGVKGDPRANSSIPAGQFFSEASKYL